MTHGFSVSSLIVSIILFSIGPITPSAQDLATLPASATPQSDLTPEYDVEVTSRIHEDSVTELDRFTYEVELTWEGSQQWLSLDSPEVEWPEGVKQIEASQRSGSSVGDKGPVGKKSFLYKLEAQKAGAARLPSIRIQLLAPGAKDPITIEAPGATVTVQERKPAASEKITTFLSTYLYLVLGVAALLLVALGMLFLRTRKDRRVEGSAPDPWVPIDELLKKAESLRGSGRDRDYYESVEKGVRAAFILATGVPNPANPDMIQGLPTTVAEDLKSLLNECSERKYRPDRPRPEEMDRSLRQARNVLKTLKELHQKRGS